MCILLLFNKYDNISYQQILQITQIPESELKYHMIPLISKVNVLQKSPNNKDIQPTDIYSVNNAFKSSLFKVKVPVA